MVRIPTLVCWFAACLLLSGGCYADTGEAGDHPLVMTLVQYPIEGNRTVDQILDKMESFIRQADDRSQCIVFPELITFDAWRVDQVETHWEPTEDEIQETKRIARDIAPSFWDGVRRLSSRYEVAILAGTTPRLVDDRLLNTAAIFFSDGTRILQDKLYPTRWEILAGITGGSDLKLLNLPWGRSVILTCYDIEFPNVAASLAKTRQPPEIIFVPSMTESEHGLARVRWCAQARSVELHSMVVVCGTVGQPSQDWSHFGQAALIEPRDSLFTCDPTLGPLNQPTVLDVRLDVALLRESRQNTAFNPSAVLSAGSSNEPFSITEHGILEPARVFE